MAMKIRLARGGSKKRPHYAIVATDSRMPRDGRFLEKLGTYNPLLAKDDEKRVVLDTERAKYWVEKGAQPTDRVARFLDAAGIKERAARNNPQKAESGQKAKDRAEDRAAKLAEAEEAAKEAANAPAEEEAAPAEEAVVEAPTEEAAAEAPAEEAAAEEATPAAEEAPAEEAAAAEEAAPAAEEAPAEESGEEKAEG